MACAANLFPFVSFKGRKEIRLILTLILHDSCQVSRNRIFYKAADVLDMSLVVHFTTEVLKSPRFHFSFNRQCSPLRCHNFKSGKETFEWTGTGLR